MTLLFGIKSCSVLININAFNRSADNVLLNLFLIIFNFEKDRSQYTWVHGNVNTNLYNKYKLE